MEFTKNRWQSRTIIAQLVAMIGLVANLTGLVKIDEWTQASIVDTVFVAGTVISQVLAIYYRIKATTKVNTLE